MIMNVIGCAFLVCPTEVEEDASEHKLRGDSKFKA
jgi:hypothetical protein